MTFSLCLPVNPLTPMANIMHVYFSETNYFSEFSGETFFQIFRDRFIFFFKISIYFYDFSETMEYY